MDDFTVSDVYEHAAKIGQDIEKIVCDYGREVIEDILPKIVFVLEQLEAFVSKHKASQDVLSELRIEKERLFIHTKRDEAIQRQLEEKIEYLQSVIGSDKKKLQDTIIELRQQNDELREDVAVLQQTELQHKASAYPGDVEVMLRMKATIDTQRDQIRQMGSEIRAQKEEIDALQEQSLRLSDINERLRASVDRLSEQLLALDRRRWNEPSMDDSVSSITGDDGRSQGTKQEVMLDDFDSVLVQLSESRERSFELEKSFGSVCTQTDDEAYASYADLSSPEKKDPNRPRYTLGEMQKVLEERMMFKIKLQALEEELELFKDAANAAKSKPPEEDKPSGVRTLMLKFLGK